MFVFHKSLYLLLIATFLILLPADVLLADNSENSHQDGLTMSVLKDRTADGILTYVKDNLGNVYRLAPDGPQLPFGVSKDVIEAQCQKYGVKMIPIKSEMMGKIAGTAGQGWEIFKLGSEILDAYTGEDDVKESQNRVIAATIAAEVGLGMGYMISMVPGAGMPVYFLAGWSGNNVKQAFVDALDAWDAHIQAAESEIKWQESDLKLAREKVADIKTAMQAGDFEKALKMNRDLNSFSESRMTGISDMRPLNMIAWKLQSAIHDAAREAREKQKEVDEFWEIDARAKVESWNKHWEEKKRKDEEAQKLFSIKLIPESNNLKAGEKTVVGIIIDGGKPPFKLSGLIERELNAGGYTETSFIAPAEPDSYHLSIKAVDADGLERSDRVTVSVGAADQSDGKNLLAGLQKCRHIEISLSGNARQRSEVRGEFVLSESLTVQSESMRAKPLLKWNGRSFSIEAVDEPVPGTIRSDITYTIKITGTVSDNGRRIDSMTAVHTSTNDLGTSIKEISLTNVPVTDDYYCFFYGASGSAIGSHVGSLQMITRGNTPTEDGMYMLPDTIVVEGFDYTDEARLTISFYE